MAAAASKTSARVETSSQPTTATAAFQQPVFDTYARLQLAAALLEYDHEKDGKLAEQSAIFAPYRQAPTYEGTDDLRPFEQAYQKRYSAVLNEHDRPAFGGPSYIRSENISETNSPTLFADFLGSNNVDGNCEESTQAEDADLVSAWGLDSVLAKFDADSQESMLKNRNNKTR